MDAGGWDSNDYPMGIQIYRAAVIGAGAAAPVRPSSGFIPPLFPTKANTLSTLAAEIPTRSGAGIYTLTVGLRWKLAGWLDIAISIYGTAGLWGQVSAFSAATRIITFRTFAAAGAATDLTSADLAVLTITGADTSTML